MNSFPIFCSFFLSFRGFMARRKRGCTVRYRNEVSKEQRKQKEILEILNQKKKQEPNLSPLFSFSFFLYHSVLFFSFIFTNLLRRKLHLVLVFLISFLISSFRFFYFFTLLIFFLSLSFCLFSLPFANYSYTNLDEEEESHLVLHLSIPFLISSLFSFSFFDLC